MTEALAHDALLDAAALERQRLAGGHTQLFAAVLRGLSHSDTVPYALASNVNLGGTGFIKFRLVASLAAAKSFQPP